MFDLRVFQGVFDGCLEKSEFVAAIVSFPDELQGHYPPVFQKTGDAVGELDFAVGVGVDPGQGVEDVRRQNVTTDYAQVGRGLVWWWFFHDGIDLAYPIRKITAGPYYAVFVGVHPVDGLDRQYGGIILSVNFGHLRDATGVGIDEIVGEDYGEWFVSDDGASARYGVSEPKRPFLPDVNAIGAFGKDTAHIGKEVVLATRLQGDL